MNAICNQILDLAKRQVGYKEDTSKGANWTKYSRWFDTTAWQWFNTKKQNSEWCAIFICWLFAQNETLGQKQALSFLGCPTPKYNCAAGVPYLYKYLESKGYKRVDKTKGIPGDIIILNQKRHTGIIEEVKNGSYITIEGNKKNSVARGNYKISSSYISAVFHPDWSKAHFFEQKEEKPSAPVSDIITTPTTPVLSSKPVYIVNTKTDPLMLRAAAYGSAPIIARMKKGSEVTYLGTTTAGWMKVKYKTMVGWAWKDYLKKK